MPKFSTLVRNVLSNWAGLATSIVVVFILSPIIVRELGPSKYGIWIFIVAITGYLGIIEAGVTASAGRLLNFHIGRADLSSAGATVSAAVGFYLAAGLTLAGVVLAAAPFVRSLARPDLGISADELFGIVLILVANISCVFLTAVCDQMLLAKNRFDLRNVAIIAGLLLRLFITVPVLSAGGGLFALAGVQLTCSIASLFLMVIFAKMYGPKLQVGFKFITRRSLTEVLGFGKWALVNNVSSRIDHQSSVILVGAMFKPSAVAYYNVAQMLVDYALALMQSVIAVAGPDLSKRAGGGDIAAIREFVASAARVSAFLGVPLFVGIAVFGMDFIRLWMGQEFLAASQVLLILAIAKGSCLISQSIGMAIWAVGRIRLLAVSNVLASVASIGLAITLVKIFGFDFTGVAFATCAAMLAQQLFILPLIGRRVLALSYGWFLRRVVAPFIVLTLFFAPFAWLVRAYWPIVGWLDLFIVTVSVTLLYFPVGAVLLWGPAALARAAGRVVQSLPAGWVRGKSQDK